jgi:hypothetical protein
MINLTTTSKGFIMNGYEFYFQGEKEILNNEQAHVPTNKGILLIDTTMTVDGKNYSTIDQLLQELYK